MSKPAAFADPSCPSFSLSIAGIVVVVECDDPALVAELRRRYGAFSAVPHAGHGLSERRARCHLALQNSGAVQLTARIETAGQLRTSALLDTGTVFQEGVLHFTAPGYEGYIDEGAGEARLRLSSTQPLEDVDYFLRVAYALLAFQAGGLLFHAAGILHQARACLFFGPSGSGKTTVARLSPDDAVLNDDLVLLMPQKRGWAAYATPFWNPSQVRPSSPRGAPLAVLLRLVPDRTVYLEEMGEAQALAELVANVPVISADPTRSQRLLVLGQRLLCSVPAYRLHFLPDASFWRVVEHRFR